MRVFMAISRIVALVYDPAVLTRNWILILDDLQLSKTVSYLSEVLLL